MKITRHSRTGIGIGRALILLQSMPDAAGKISESCDADISARSRETKNMRQPRSQYAGAVDSGP